MTPTKPKDLMCICTESRTGETAKPELSLMHSVISSHGTTAARFSSEGTEKSSWLRQILRNFLMSSNPKRLYFLKVSNQKSLGRNAWHLVRAMEKVSYEFLNELLIYSHNNY